MLQARRTRLFIIYNLCNGTKIKICHNQHYTSAVKDNEPMISKNKKGEAFFD
jgi:hypothetical protein